MDKEVMITKWFGRLQRSSPAAKVDISVCMNPCVLSTSVYCVWTGAEYQLSRYAKG